jgi:hypothetical protein
MVSLERTMPPSGHYHLGYHSKQCAATNDDWGHLARSISRWLALPSWDETSELIYNVESMDGPQNTTSELDADETGADSSTLA